MNLQGVIYMDTDGIYQVINEYDDMADIINIDPDSPNYEREYTVSKEEVEEFLNDPDYKVTDEVIKDILTKRLNILYGNAMITVNLIVKTNGISPEKLKSVTDRLYEEIVLRDEWSLNTRSGYGRIFTDIDDEDYVYIESLLE